MKRSKGDVALLEQASEEEKPDISSAIYAEVHAMGVRLLAVEEAIEKTKEHLAELIKEREELRVRQMPAKMFQLNTHVLGVDNHSLVVEPLIVANLPKEEKEREKAINWLVDNKEGGVVKRILTLDLPKGDAVAEAKVVAAIGKVSKAFKPSIKYDIHHSTFTALCKRLVASGKQIPLDTLGVFIGQIVRVDPK